MCQKKPNNQLIPNMKNINSIILFEFIHFNNKNKMCHKTNPINYLNSTNYDGHINITMTLFEFIKQFYNLQ
jgi:hypothetical protein